MTAGFVDRDATMRRYVLPFMGLIFSGALVLASLYQLEIIFIWVAQGRLVFEFPFYSFTTSVWFARDIFYGLLVLGWVLAGVSTFYIGAIREVEVLFSDAETMDILRDMIREYREDRERKRKPQNGV